MIQRPPELPVPSDIDPAATVPLVALAWARSGDNDCTFGPDGTAYFVYGMLQSSRARAIARAHMIARA